MVIKAEVKSAKIGPLSIEGLMSENGDFAVAVPQASERFQIASNQASRSIKTLLGTGFQFDKWKSPLHPKKVNVLQPTRRLPNGTPRAIGQSVLP